MANFVYGRYEPLHADVAAAIVAQEGHFLESVAEVDKAAMTLIRRQDIAAAVELVTSFSEKVCIKN